MGWTKEQRACYIVNTLTQITDEIENGWNSFSDEQKEKILGLVGFIQVLPQFSQEQ